MLCLLRASQSHEGLTHFAELCLLTASALLLPMPGNAFQCVRLCQPGTGSRAEHPTLLLSACALLWALTGRICFPSAGLALGSTLFMSMIALKCCEGSVPSLSTRALVRLQGFLPPPGAAGTAAPVGVTHSFASTSDPMC